MLYQKCLRYIRQLKIPEGFEIECVAVRNVSSITMGYNTGMTQSNAKYKVYLHQDVFIVNKNFIKLLISNFNKNSSIGIIGVIGAKKLPLSCIWWESALTIGKVMDSHTGKLKLIDFQKEAYELAYVQVVDGLLMATSYDVKWREDLFDGWHFYDASQCFEFLKRGYYITIPYQKKLWCIHSCGVVSIKDYEKYRRIFIKEYLEEEVSEYTL